MLNPYVLLGLLAAFVFTNGYTAYKVRSHYIAQCDAAKFESQVRTLQVQLDNQKRATITAEKERDGLKMREDELETVVADYEKQLKHKPATEPGQKPDIVTVCVDSRAARALRAIR